MKNIREEAIEYMTRAEIVIKRLLQVLLKILNVNDIDKETEHELMGAMRLNFNYYPKCPNPELTAGVGRHSDISTITVLLQDDSGGLYVCREGSGADSWIHVPHVDGALVINIGDVLQIMSNGLYKSVEHRALPNKNKSRISIPIFVNPGPDALIGPLPQVLGTGEKPIYKQVLYLDYFKHFFSNPHDGKKAIEFAKICE
ncbi:feruloyl CoA ortho-hydroxylase 1-like [Morus notabilis]|uniref:feruloyl CoA ortho-hydroxylase 1-like n=1 Tax=Morus notabilis TaxID=981085 RepID=UPI000CED175E|nr:feruloyl CoA ortho-hydroxylase 1-like [Morus notabilis]